MLFEQGSALVPTGDLKSLDEKNVILPNRRESLTGKWILLTSYSALN